MYKKGTKANGTITGIQSYGAFVKLNDENTGLIHISEFSDGFVKSIEDFVKIGDNVSVKVLEYNDQIKKYNLSLKKIGLKNKGKKEVIKLTIGFKTLDDNLQRWVEESK